MACALGASRTLGGFDLRHEVQFPPQNSSQHGRNSSLRHCLWKAQPRCSSRMLGIKSSSSSSVILEEPSDFWTRLQRAWQIMFPAKQNPASNAQVAKRRLKMILISDRCSVNDEAKRKIVDNIVGALADFVEIEREDRVELNVSTSSDLGTVYYVTVPVRRVKPEFQDYTAGDIEAQIGRASELAQQEAVQEDWDSILGAAAGD